ncbi:hypothetical protein IT408_01095 [Candidatus Uhrbacteria bacterium]|nr:hypothetical protein [Candidatus Uhrbacteria bacterium]
MTIDDNKDMIILAETLKQRIRDAQSPFSQTTICGLLQAEMVRKGHKVSLKRLTDFDAFTTEQIQMAEIILPTVIGSSLSDQTIQEIAVSHRTTPK